MIVARISCNVVSVLLAGTQGDKANSFRVVALGLLLRWRHDDFHHQPAAPALTMTRFVRHFLSTAEESIEAFAMNKQLAVMFSMFALCNAARVNAADWITQPSYYTHDPMSGERVTQYTPIGPFYSYAQPSYTSSGYRNTRSSIQVGTSADHYHTTQQWGAPVQPYGEWRFPYRPYSVPYGAWGPQYYGGIPYGYGRPLNGLGLGYGGGLPGVGFQEAVRVGLGKAIYNPQFFRDRILCNLAIAASNNC